MHTLSCDFPYAGRLVLGAIIIFASPRGYADVSISADPTQNISCSDGICSPTATDAVLNVSDLENLLASGNVEVTTTGSGVQASNIDVTAPFSWSSSGILTLDAYQSIKVDAAVSVESLAGLTLITDDGGASGTLSFGEGANVDFADLDSSLTINGASFTLVDTILSLAAAIAANPSGNYAFASSYDAKPDGTYRSVPVSTAFAGTLEGLGNTVSHLTIKDSVDEYVGFFGTLISGGTLRDFGLLDVKISASGSAEFGAPLVGNTGGTVVACHASGKLGPGRERVGYGGLVGLNEGNISYSYAVTNASALGSAGGLVVTNYGAIENSYAKGNIKISGRYGAAGGLVVTNAGTIDSSFATESVVGGIANWNGGLASENGGQISNSYATGDVSADAGSGKGLSQIGGLIGHNSASVASSYSTGSSRGAGAQPTCGGRREYTCVGGSMGYNNGTPANVYWDTTTSGNANAVGDGSASGITGMTSEQLKSGLPTGFDPSIWGQQMGVNHGFPYLLAIPPTK